MFQDVVIGCARFKSKPIAQCVDAATSTSAIPTSESETQTDGGWADSGTQTEPKASSTSTSSSSRKDASAAPSEEELAKVRASLDRLGPIMLREMAESARTSAYFADLERYLESSEEKNVTKLFSLRFDFDAYFQSTQQSDATAKSSAAPTPSLKFSCTGVSWNATGAMIAVAFGRFDHTGWCDYRAALCLWKVFQSDLNTAKPHTVLETSSGLMCVAFHPKNPSLVAAGSFNGEVLVWDLEHDEYRFYASGIGDYFHREPVTKVAWVYDVQGGEFNVASVSGDGKVLFWRLKDKLAFPVEGYVLHLPASISSAKSSPVIGGKSLAFSPSDKTSRSFVVGSEGGAIIRCFSKGTARASDFKGDKKWTATAARLIGRLASTKIPALRRQVETYATEKKSKEITLAMVYDAKIDPAVLYPSAVDFVFEGHMGPVYDVSFSPFRKSIFASCSSDGTARLFSYLQKEPLLSLEVTPTSAYLYSVEWSKTRPTVLAIAAEDGNVYVYDLKVDRVAPVLVLSAKDSSNSSSGRRSSSSSSRRSNESAAAASTTRASSSSAAANTTSAAAMFALDFNPRQRNFLAAGDAAGAVHIWKLPWHLANLQSGELAMLEAIEEDASAAAIA
ncbi:hypothetical protein P43SY_006648 [Pythium insidiosum]|uniref:Uncharacterized protein n=1 Tax=Pythium insidiosum TaxID=114742 RepID=A0AAD5LZ72_PYTIN|nr:hypothetical protein P43SY_006648 [Pythium insidiosum]